MLFIHTLRAPFSVILMYMRSNSVVKILIKQDRYHIRDLGWSINLLNYCVLVLLFRALSPLLFYMILVVYVYKLF